MATARADHTHTPARYYRSGVTTAPKNPEGPLHRAVRLSLTGVDKDDRGAAALALVYAGRIDARPDSAETYGPMLLRVLDALGRTTKARAAGRPAAAGTPKGRLDELRARAATRAQRAAG